MWLFTKEGFYSIVQKKGDTMLTIRSRSYKDLENLRLLLPKRTPLISSSTRTDYQFRMCVSRDELRVVMHRLVDELTYDNFKHEVGRNDKSRARLYEQVWFVLRNWFGKIPNNF